MNIRRYRVGEEETLRRLHIDTTRKVNARDYTPEQIERWASRHADPGKWKERIRDRNPFVAELHGAIVGFAELEPDGHIDYFYCHHEFQRQGVGSALMQMITQEADRLGLARLYASVSTTAMKFFLAKSFKIDEERNNIVCEHPAKQYLMSSDRST